MSEESMAEENPITVEEVRCAQESLKNGITLHEKKSFKESIEEFKKSAMTHPFDSKHVEELGAKLKSGSYKLQQESIAYLGCAAVHLNKLISSLDESQRQEVPVDESLMSAFKEWQ
jgi:anti-sigma28 factor (negative regulator of flagellin synthesis)